MGTSAADITVGIDVHANADGIASAERASAAIQKFTVTIEQSRELMARAGGDFEKYKQLLRELVTSQQAAAVAAQQQATAQQQTAAATQQATTAQAAQTTGQKAATQATVQSTTATQQNAQAQAQAAVATTQAGNAAQVAAQKTTAIIPPANAATAAINKIPSSARTAANALSIIALNAANGTGSLSGFANAAGSVAFGLSNLSGSAKLVAGAAGFGAIVTVVGVLIGLYDTLVNRQEKVNAKLGDLSRDIAGLNPEQLRERIRATDDFIKKLGEQREALAKSQAAASAAVVSGAGGAGAGFLAGAVAQYQSLSRLDDRIAELYKHRQTLADQTAVAEVAAQKESTDATIKANEAALESYIRRTQGETAARRRAIDFEEQAAIGAARISGESAERIEARITSIRREANAQRAEIDHEEAERIAKAREQNEVRLAKNLETVQIAASKSATDRLEATNAEQRAKRLISEREFIATRETLELKEIGRVESARLESIDTQIAAQRKLLDATSEPAKKTAIAGEITALTDSRNAVIQNANQQSTAVQAQAAKDTADLARKLSETIQQSTAEVLEAEGRMVEAATGSLHRQFDDLIREAEQAGDAVGAAMLRARRDIGIQQANVREIDQGVARASTTAENEIARTNSLLSVRAISAQQAKETIIAALQSEHDAIERATVALERQVAASPWADPETLDKIDAYRTKIAELNAELTKLKDPFFALKQVGLSATQDALAGFFQGLTQLGRQDRSEIRSLSADLAETRAELNELLAIPANDRTTAANNRITELRNQIEATTASLDQAKSSITTWRDLFVGALQSIADALVRVSSEMLATALIQKALGIFVGAGIGGASQTLSGDTLGAGAGRAFGATGGQIIGPGTGTSDSIPAMLSNEEYVVNAARTRQYLPVLHAINFDPDPPQIALPRAVRHYAGGGFVAAASASAFGREPNDPLHLVLSVRDSNDHIVTVTEAYHKGPQGRKVTLEHVQQNPRQLGR